MRGERFALAVFGPALLAAIACTASPPQPTGYRLIADGTYHAGTPPPGSTWAVAGRCESDGFVPMGALLGDGELGETGRDAWLELADGSLHLISGGRRAVRPFVAGFLGDDARFLPRRPEIVY